MNLKDKALNGEIDDKKIEEAVKLLMGGGTVRQARGFTRDQMETMYSVAYNLYATRQLEKADTVFRYLTYLDHTNAKYWIGLGAVQQLRRDFAHAVASYGYAAFLDLKNAKPLYHVAECYLALGDSEKAESALTAMKEYSDASSPYQARAQKLAERIKAA